MKLKQRQKNIIAFFGIALISALGVLFSDAIKEIFGNLSGYVKLAVVIIGVLIIFYIFKSLFNIKVKKLVKGF